MSEAKSGDTVRIHYTGTLDDGSQFDSSSGGDPLEFTIGAGQVIPGLEKEIAGMKVGDRKTVKAAADEAYGPRLPEATQEVPRASLPAEVELVVGKKLRATNQDGSQMVVTIAEVRDDAVVMDANHPLAGKDLTFEVELVEIL